MGSGDRAYRLLVLLYPRHFRAHYGDDLVAHFADLVADVGRRAAWRRTAVDLVVTVPRFRMEAIVNIDRSSGALATVIALLAIAGLSSVLVGLYWGLSLVVIAAVLGVTQRTSLARAISTLNPDRRRRRLTSAGLATAVFVACYVVFLAVVGDRWTVRETVLAAVGTVAMVVAAAFLVAGLLTPRPGRRPVVPTGG